MFRVDDHSIRVGDVTNGVITADGLNEKGRRRRTGPVTSCAREAVAWDARHETTPATPPPSSSRVTRRCAAKAAAG